MTKKFREFIDNYELDQTQVKNFRVDKQYLKDASVVMPGREIFEIFRKGTECKI